MRNKYRSIALAQFVITIANFGSVFQLLNAETLQMERCKVWSSRAIEIFREIDGDSKKLVFEVIEQNHGGQLFGKLLYSLKNNNNNGFECVARTLCRKNEAVTSKNYLSGEFKPIFAVLFSLVL